MSLPKPPSPCFSLSRIELPAGYTCTNEFFHVSADIIPPDFPYALEHDTIGARVPYRYYTGPGPPHPSVGLPGDIYYDSLSNSSPAYAAPKGYTRTLTEWTPWGGAGSLVHHPLLPVYALCPVWDEAARKTIAHEWGHVDSTTESRLLEKQVYTPKAAADVRLEPVLSPRADVEARTHRAGDDSDALKTLSLCGAPLLTHLSSKRNAFIAQMTEWTEEIARIEVELVKVNAELEASKTSISVLEHKLKNVETAHNTAQENYATLKVTSAKSISPLEDKLKDVEAAHIVLQTKHRALAVAHTASDAALVANIAAIKTSFAGDREEWNTEKKGLLDQLDSEQRTAEEVEVILAEKDEEIARLGAQLENGQTEARETETVLRATLAGKYEEITSLGVRLNAVQNSHVARSELVAKEAELTAAQNAHPAFLQSKDAHIARLEKDVKALRKGHNVDVGTGPDSASDSDTASPAPTGVPVANRSAVRPSPIGMNSKDTNVASAFDWASGSGTPRPPMHLSEIRDNRNGPGSWATGYAGSSISAPSQPRPTGASALNPLNFRKHDSLTRKHGSLITANPTSGKTVISFRRNQDCPPAQTPKRLSPNERRRDSGYPLAGPHGMHSKREGKQNATPTAICSLSEDEGQSSSTQSSPDPLTLRSTTFKHASDNSPTRLRNKLRQASKEIIISDSDDGQEFSDRPDDQSQSAGTRKHTQGQESAYTRGETTRSAGKESARSSIPHLDLSLMHRRPIASGMKPKCTNLAQSKINPFHPKLAGGDQFGDHPLPAPTFNPSKSRQKSPSQAKQEDSVELPLEAWSCGVKIYDTGTLKFFFVWNPQTCTVSVRCNREHGPSTVLEQICINQITDFKVAITAPITPSMLLLIQLGTLAYDRKGGTEEHYKPGSQAADGKLTFNFSVRSADWSNAKYHGMVASLRKQSIDTDTTFTYIDVHGSDALWEGAICAQESYTHNQVHKRSERATVSQVTTEASDPGSSGSAIPASSIARRITPPQLAHQLREPLHARKLPSANTDEMSAASLNPLPASVPTSVLPAVNSGSLGVPVPSAASLPQAASASVLPTRAPASTSELVPGPLAIKREIAEDTGMALKRKRSTAAIEDTRQAKRSAEGKARAVEREVIDLTLSSDDEDGDKAANKNGNSQAVPMDVDAEGDANAKDNGLPLPPSLPLPRPPSQYGHRKQVEASDSHPEPDNQAELEVACEPTTEPAALPLQEPLLTSSSISPTSTIAKTEPTDAPLLDTIPSRPPLSHAHVRLAFKKGEDHLLCLACLIAKSTTMISPPTDAAAVDHLAAAHGEWVTSLLTQSSVELKKAWKKMKEGGRRG